MSVLWVTGMGSLIHCLHKASIKIREILLRNQGTSWVELRGGRGPHACFLLLPLRLSCGVPWLKAQGHVEQLKTIFWGVIGRADGLTQALCLLNQDHHFLYSWFQSPVSFKWVDFSIIPIVLFFNINTFRGVSCPNQLYPEPSIDVSVCAFQLDSFSQNKMPSYSKNKHTNKTFWKWPI